MLRIFGRAFLLLSVSASGLSAECVGDFDANDRVDVHEIVRLLNCALGDVVCSHVDVADLTTAIANALEGCGRAKWLSKNFGVQCEAPAVTVDEVLVVVNQLAGVAHDSCVGAVAALCCGCPEFYVSVLARPGAVASLRADGWSYGGRCPPD